MRAPKMLAALSAAYLIGGTPAAASPAIDPNFAAVEAAPWKRNYARDLGKRSIFVAEVSAPDDFPGTAAILHKALRKSLAEFGLDSKDLARAEYVLSAAVFEFAAHDAERMLSTTVQAGIDYRIVDARSGAPLFEEKIRTQFTASAPRKDAAADMKEALARTHSKRQLMAKIGAQQQKAEPEDFRSVRCEAKDTAQGPIGDGELEAKARKACAQNHALHANLEAFFARLLVYRPAPLQASAERGRREQAPKKAQR